MELAIDGVSRGGENLIVATKPSTGETTLRQVKFITFLIVSSSKIDDYLFTREGKFYL